MKILTAFSLLMLVFIGCTSAKYQEMQNERDSVRAAFEDARRKHDPRTMELAFTDELLGTWELLSLEVEEGDVSEEIAALKYDIHATARKNLTLEFFMDRNVFRRYRGKNGETEITGSFKISPLRYGGELFPFLRIFRDTGEPLPQFISGMAQSRLETGESVSMNISPLSNWLGISVTEDRLHIILYGAMQLTSNGWAQSGGIRCTFKRVK